MIERIEKYFTENEFVFVKRIMHRDAMRKIL